METIAITLNGQEVSGHPGMTVLELARESGINIPTLCNAPNLAPYGACRICIVEDERTGALLASCVTPIAAGMVINTDSPKVLERRAVIIKLMLASHPDSCMVCDKGNHCELRRIASDYGIGLLDLQRIPQPIRIEDVNPFLERDLSKCILCAKCIRADQELVVEGAIDYVGRGFSSKPATLNMAPLEQSDCTFCGTCVALCPTGALMLKEKPFRGSSNRAVPTICPFCGCGCGIILEVKNNRLVGSRPDTNGCVNRGTSCVGGSYGWEIVHSPERLTTPLVRINGDFKQVSWEEALDATAAGMAQVKTKSGAESLAVLGSARCTNEELYLLQKFARCALGTNNVDNSSRLYSSASRLGLGWNLGLRGTTSLLDNLERSEVIMVIGANPTSSAPAVGYAIKRAVRYRGAKLILVDPQQTKLSQFATIWMKPRPGTDVALLNGMARVIVTEGLADEEFVARRTDNFEALNLGLEPYTLDYVDDITGVASSDVQAAARLFAKSNQASIVYGNGITQYATGTDGVMALANLAMLTGNVGHRAGGIYALQRECNGLGAADMGAIPSFLPGYQSVEKAEVAKLFADRWGVRPPSAAGLTAGEMILRADQGAIKGMYVVGDDPLRSMPDEVRTRRALSSLDFLVVQDMFLTATARIANVVLPSASFAEKEGTLTNFEGRVQRLRKVVPPIGHSLPDWEILVMLARKMNHPMPYQTLQQVMDEIEEMVPLYQGLGYADSDMKGLYRADQDNVTAGNRRLYKGQFPNGFGRFSPVEYIAQTDAGDGYPFTLIAGTSLFHLSGGSQSFGASRLNRFLPEDVLELSAPDAEKLGISNGESVRVSSRIGSITATAKVSDNVSEGILFISAASSTNPVTRLLEIVLDPKARTPSQKACAVRLERNVSDESA